MYPKHFTAGKGAFLLAAIVCLATLPGVFQTQLSAQAASGTLTGVVTDQSGAAIVGAAVRIVDAETNSGRTAITNDVGRYTVVNLNPGTYNINVTKDGFTAARLTAQKIEIGQV